jgi:hypothetical protein
MVNQDVAAGLVAFFAPIIALWFLIGLALAILYNLSLYYVDAEFRIGSERALDLFVAVLRAIAFFFAWPVIFYFDRSALIKIKLMLLYLSPRQREQNADLRLALRERDYRRWVRRWALDEEERHEKSDPTVLAREREKRLRVVHEGSPELERVWLLAGSGMTPGGSSQVVGMSADDRSVNDVAARARYDLSIRRPWVCLRCRTPLEPETIELPELTWLRVVEPGTARTVLEGWALDGRYRQTFSYCPDCGKEQPEMVGDVSELGHAADVLRAVRSGLTVHSDPA